MKELKLSNDEANGMRKFYEAELEQALRKIEHIQSVLEKLGGESPTINIKVERADTPTVSIETTTAPAPKKRGPKPGSRRRGRSPKAKKAAVAASETPAAATETAAVEKPKKRRGRPPKSASAKKAAAPRKQGDKKRKTGPKAKWGPFITDTLAKEGRPLTYTELTDMALKAFKLPKGKVKSTKQAVVNTAFRLRNQQKAIDTYGVKGQKEKYLGLTEWFTGKDKLKAEYADKVPADS